MWLSKIISNNTFSKRGAAFSKVTASSSTKEDAAGSVERYAIRKIAPYGIAAVAPVGCESVLLPTDDGDISLGVISEEKQLMPGEVMLFSSGGASIVLKNDGRVLINGREVS